MTIRAKCPICECIGDWIPWNDLGLSECPYCTVIVRNPKIFCERGNAAKANINNLFVRRPVEDVRPEARKMETMK